MLDAEPPRHDTDDIANASLRPEIVIGLVGALGTDLAVVQKELKNALMSVGYGSTVVRVSELIERNYGWLFNGSSSLSRLDELMDIGDALREDTKYEAAAAALAVSEISTARHDEFESLNASGDSELSDALWERDSRATIIRSLKHPDEVRLLRSVYGPRFVLLAAWSPRVEREKDVGDRLRQYHSTKDEAWVSSNVTRLLDRDEEDSERDFGQQVRDAFELADFYLALIPGRSVEGSLGRLVRLLFGHPYETPTWQEQAMYQASGARLRSSAAGRQVGAVIVDGAGELLVTGVNEAPKAGGGQYWTDDELDHRDFRYGYDVNERQQLSIIMDVLWRLQKANWLGADRAGANIETLASEAFRKGGPLAKSRIKDLLEFGRIAHAEMAAICTAARRGTPIQDAVMFTTTYPCHECARLIIAAGIARVVYVDPYPKSRVSEMYRHEVTETLNEVRSRVVFEPFEGVAPRLYRSVFSMIDRIRDPITRDFSAWEPEKALPRLVAEAETTYPPQYMEDSVSTRIERLLRAVGWIPGGQRL